MPYLIVRNTEGHEVLTRELWAEESHLYHQAWMAGERVTLEGCLYRIHSVARTRPEQNIVLCVSLD